MELLTFNQTEMFQLSKYTFQIERFVEPLINPYKPNVPYLGPWKTV